MLKIKTKPVINSKIDKYDRKNNYANKREVDV